MINTLLLVPLLAHVEFLVAMGARLPPGHGVFPLRFGGDEFGDERVFYRRVRQREFGDDGAKTRF